MRTFRKVLWALVVAQLTLSALLRAFRRLLLWPRFELVGQMLSTQEGD